MFFKNIVPTQFCRMKFLHILKGIFQYNLLRQHFTQYMVKNKVISSFLLKTRVTCPGKRLLNRESLTVTWNKNDNIHKIKSITVAIKLASNYANNLISYDLSLLGISSQAKNFIILRDVIKKKWVCIKRRKYYKWVLLFDRYRP